MPYSFGELVVMTRPVKLTERTPGHAMVAISIAGVGEEAWGFYPKGVKDEIAEGGWHRYNRQSVIPISKKQYTDMKTEIEKWKSKDYIMGYRDCTDFALAVLKAANISVPKDSIATLPDDFGADIVSLNGGGGGRCLARP
ncbi:MAG TPA: hypothetical protein PLY05_13620 [Agitococcus sp.]|nr:hypothetical protein [Agitococcus sp.]